MIIRSNIEIIFNPIASKCICNDHVVKWKYEWAENSYTPVK